MLRMVTRVVAMMRLGGRRSFEPLQKIRTQIVRMKSSARRCTRLLRKVYGNDDEATTTTRTTTTTMTTTLPTTLLHKYYSSHMPCRCVNIAAKDNSTRKLTMVMVWHWWRYQGFRGHHRFRVLLFDGDQRSGRRQHIGSAKLRQSPQARGQSQGATLLVGFCVSDTISNCRNY